MVAFGHLLIGIGLIMTGGAVLVTAARTEKEGTL